VLSAFWSIQTSLRIDLFLFNWQSQDITSSGGIILGLNEEEFFEGYSNPRNKELMRIFKDLGMVEQLGSGLPRILKVYPKECFKFTANFLRITLPVNPDVMKQLDTDKMADKTESNIIELLRIKPEITINDITNELNVAKRTVERNISKLKKDGKIARVGGKKVGHWEVLDEN